MTVSSDNERITEMASSWEDLGESGRLESGKACFSAKAATSVNGKGRHFSLGTIYERRNSRRKSGGPLSLRLAAAYRSARTARLPAYCPEKAMEGIREEEEEPDEGSTEIDAGSPPPVDESLFFDNLGAFKRAALDEASLKSALWSIVSVPEMKVLLDMEKGSMERVERELPKLKRGGGDRLLNVAFLWACFRGLSELLPRLEAAGAEAHYVEPVTGLNGVLVAALSGSVVCLEHLVVQRRVDVNHRANRAAGGYTALHLAALANCREAAELLLDNGASCCWKKDDDVNSVEPVLFCAIRAKAERVIELLLERHAGHDWTSERNELGESALHVAVKANLPPRCLETILSEKHHLVDILDATDTAGRTALHYAVMNTSCAGAELVELLLRTGAEVNIADNSSFTPLHIAALNEQSQCVESLIWAGADLSATTSSGLTALNIILRKIPESLQVFRDRLDASIRLKRPVPHNREFEMRLHFEPLLPCSSRASTTCETSFINTFVQEHRKDLLSHPLVMAFLHLKWEKIRKFYLMRIFLYSLMVVCMTSYVLTGLAYKCYNNNNSGSSANNNNNNNNNNNQEQDPTPLVVSKICSSGARRASGFLFRRPIIELQWYLALALTLVTILPRKALSFVVYKSVKQYLSNVENILDTIVVVSVFGTSFVYTGKTYDWQNYVGAFAILCAWTNLMLMVGQLPAFGNYVAMFTHIQLEFAKLLLAYSGLLIGFTISFCVIFVGEPSFGNPFTGLIKVLAMMAGELDFEGLINDDDDVLLTDGSYLIYHPLSVCSQILFTLFIVFVTVILMNLLVGIAVHDIQGLRNHAGLTKLMRQTKLILFTEMVLSDESLPWASFTKYFSEHKIDMDNRKRLLVVKPLNPLEKRLPKDILKAAYEIAQKNAPLIGDDEELYLAQCAPRRSSHHQHQQHDDEGDPVLGVRAILDDLQCKILEQQVEIKMIKEHLLRSNEMLGNINERIFK